jgi:hypothetical protein
MRGQIAVVAFFTVGILILGILLMWPVIQPMLLSFQGTDPLVNFLLDVVGIAIVAAALIAFFVFLAAEHGR